MADRICPECGRKMKQQFIGLKHCKCGMSWLKSEGYFQKSANCDKIEIITQEADFLWQEGKENR